MKQLRLGLAAFLILSSLCLTSVLRSQTRTLTKEENAAITACASRYYRCNGQCQKQPTAEARASCEAECMREYNDCVNASVRPQPPTDLRANASPPAYAPVSPTPMPRYVPPQRVSSFVPTATATPVATVVPPNRARGVVAQPSVPPATPAPPRLNYARRPIGGSMRAKPTQTPTPAATSPTPLPQRMSTVTTAQPTPTISPLRSTSHRKSRTRHRSEEPSPTPSPEPTKGSRINPGI